MSSQLIKNQKKTLKKEYKENDIEFKIEVTLRYDDECGNGHNSFAITGSIDRKGRNGRWEEDCGGCIHEEIVKHFPDLEPYVKWHLTSSDEPMHYIANTKYFVEKSDFKSARITAVWPDSTESDLQLDGLEERLKERLSVLQKDFRLAMEELGFTF